MKTKSNSPLNQLQDINSNTINSRKEVLNLLGRIDHKVNISKLEEILELLERVNNLSLDLVTDEYNTFYIKG